MARPWQLRPNALAQIHMGKAELGMDDDTYRAMLHAQAGVSSAKDLTANGRNKVLMHLRACGATFTRRANQPQSSLNQKHPQRPLNPPEHQVPQLSKIEALLTDAGRPWAYVNGMCRRMYQIERIEFANAEQLQGLITALVKDVDRRAARAVADQAATETNPKKDAA